MVEISHGGRRHGGKRHGLGETPRENEPWGKSRIRSQCTIIAQHRPSVYDVVSISAADDVGAMDILNDNIVTIN